jgi:proteasome lid subunit RPN8/RPN11
MSGWDPNQMRRITFLDGIPDNQVRTLAAQTSFHARKSAQRQLCSVPELAYRLDTGSRVTTTFSSDLCRALRNRCAESNIHRREVGGILVGYSQTTSRLFHRHYQLLMTDVVPVESRDSSSTHVAFDRNAWLKIEREIDMTYGPEGKRRLGWYHTHPVQGIFFSPQDREVHSIFKKPFELAIVVDPKTMEAGLYYWRNYREKSLAGPLRFPLPV